LTLTLNANRSFGSGFLLAESQSVSDDGEMLARWSNFPPKKIRMRLIAQGMVQVGGVLVRQRKSRPLAGWMPQAEARNSADPCSSLR
jgi:hypothetical protein